jgi:hypothetical protein
VLAEARSDVRAALRARFRIARSAALQGCPAAVCRPKGLRYKRPPLILKRTHRLVIAVLAALPTAATLLFEWTTHVTPPNEVRAAAGLVLGGAVAWLVMRELGANHEVN